MVASLESKFNKHSCPDRFFLCKYLAVATRFPPLGGTPPEIGHQSVGQKYTQIKTISWTVEMGQQSVNNFRFLY